MEAPLQNKSGNKSVLIWIGIIVIEHFLQASPSPAPPATQISASQPPADAVSDSPPSAELTDRPASRPTVESDAYLAGLDKKQVELRIKRTELLLEYTKQHPDVVQVDRQLEQLRIERRRYLRQREKN